MRPLHAAFLALAAHAAAAGGTGAIMWWIDGRPVPVSRWRLVPGAHTIRAATTHGQSDTVHIEVARAGPMR